MIPEHLLSGWRSQTKALEDLYKLAQVERILNGLMLIGATARLLQLDWPARLETQRTTKDVDLILQVKSWAEFSKLAANLISSGSYEKGRQPHQFIHRETATLIDLVPYGDLEDPAGTVRWPITGNDMSVLGMAEAHETAELKTLSPQLELPVVTLPCFTALKIIAWNDRKRSDKGGGDLRDADFVMRNCCQLPHFEAAAWQAYSLAIELPNVAAHAADLDFGEHAGAAVIANELKNVLRRETRELLLSIIAPLAESSYARGMENLISISPQSDDEQKRRVISLRYTIMKEILAEETQPGIGKK